MPAEATENIESRGLAEPSAAVRGMQEAWRLVEDLMGGTSAMRKAGERHLPKDCIEEETAYQIRLKTATLFPAYSRTVSILTGKPFSKPMTIGDDVPERIKVLLNDADLEGRNLHSFMVDVVHDALAYGLCGILVDCPPRSDDVRTLGDEAAAGIRPYLVHVRHDAILGWKAEKRGSSMELTQLRLMESVEVEDGRFGTKDVEQVRVLEPGRWETWRKVKAKNGRESWQPYESGTTSLGVIPFVPVYGRRKDFMIGEPPMLELAHLNVEHWQSKSDQQAILHVARVPILCFTGVPKDERVAITAGSIFYLESAEAGAKWVEHTGSAIEAGRVSILDLEDQMRQVGAELLVIKPGNTTVVQTRSDNEPAMCDLQRIMQSAEDGADLALYFMALFLKEPAGGHVTIFSDFGVASLPEASAQLVLEMHAEGLITHATALGEMQRRNVIAADVNVATEVPAATFERDAMQAKAAERERAMLMANMAESADREMAENPVDYQGGTGTLAPLHF